MNAYRNKSEFIYLFIIEHKTVQKARKRGFIINAMFELP